MQDCSSICATIRTMINTVQCATVHAHASAILTAQGKGLLIFSQVWGGRTIVHSMALTEQQDLVEKLVQS